jgi:hypothetical protein
MAIRKTLSAAEEYARSAHQFGSCRLLFALCATVLRIKRYSLCVASESGGQQWRLTAS